MNRRERIRCRLGLALPDLQHLIAPWKKTPAGRRFCCPANAGTKKIKGDPEKQAGGFTRTPRSDPRGAQGAATGGLEGSTKEQDIAGKRLNWFRPGPRTLPFKGPRGLRRPGGLRPPLPPPSCCFSQSLPAGHVARRCGSRGAAPTSGQTGSSRPGPADARLPPGGGLRRSGRAPLARPSLRHFPPGAPHVRARRRPRGGAAPARTCVHAFSAGHLRVYTPLKQ